jgi:hypothetical protein
MASVYDRRRITNTFWINRATVMDRRYNWIPSLQYPAACGRVLYSLNHSVNLENSVIPFVFCLWLQML